MADELKWVGSFAAEIEGAPAPVEVVVCCTVNEIETTEGQDTVFGHYVYSIAKQGRRVHQINGRSDLFEIEATGQKLTPLEPIDFEAFEARLRKSR